MGFYSSGGSLSLGGSESSFSNLATSFVSIETTRSSIVLPTCTPSIVQIFFATNASRHAAHSVTRKFALLRAHGLIKKIPQTHRYVLTQDGVTAITALLAARKAPLTKLTAA